MIKRLKITIDGTSYEVTAEVEEVQAEQGGLPPTAQAPEKSAVATPLVPATPVEPAVVGTRLDAIVSPLAGRVIAINVTLNQAVKEGEHVLTLEAMKMNTFVFAQKGGTVKEIKAAVGDAVQENQLLILLD